MLNPKYGIYVKLCAYKPDRLIFPKGVHQNTDEIGEIALVIFANGMDTI